MQRSKYKQQANTEKNKYRSMHEQAIKQKQTTEKKRHGIVYRRINTVEERQT